MKRRKGFTLPELLATIVIIGVLAIIATGSYSAISNSIKEKTLESKKKLIKEKALIYAEDYEVEDTTISVAGLISEGYLDAENNVNTNEKISNPFGGYLDCYHIDIKRDIADYTADIQESDNCDLADLDNKSSSIIVYAYKEDGTSLGNNKEIDWSNKNVYLYLDPSSIDSNLVSSQMKITWKINGVVTEKNGYIANNKSLNTKYSNVFEVETSLIANAIVSATVETNDGNLVKKVRVKIDKEKPILTLSATIGYTKSNKIVNFVGSDGSGSGIAEYAYYLTSNINDVPSEYDFNIKESDANTTIYENTVYYGYAIDKVGNISERVSINVTNIDYSNPICSTPEDNPTWKTSYTYSYGCLRDVGTGCKSENKNKTIKEDMITDTIEWQVEDNLGNTSQCKATVRVNVDVTPPSCEITVNGTMGDNEWYITDVKLSMSTSDALSGVVAYGISTSTTPDYNGNTTATLNYDTDGITYYGYVKDAAGNTSTCSKTVKRLATNPTCSIESSGTGGPTWYRSNVNLWVSSSSSHVSSLGFSGGLSAVETCTTEQECSSSGCFGRSCHDVERCERTASGSYNDNSRTITYDTSVNYTGYVSNEAGLTGSCSRTVGRDTTAPTASMSASEYQECTTGQKKVCDGGGCGGCDNYHYESYDNCQTVANMKEVTLTCTDSGSGISSASINGSSGTTVRVSVGTTVTGVCRDNAGNESTTSYTVKNSYSPSYDNDDDDDDDSCDSNHLSVTNCDDGGSYCTDDGDDCGGADSNGEYGMHNGGCNWHSCNQGSTKDCGHVAERSDC